MDRPDRQISRTHDDRHVPIREKGADWTGWFPRHNPRQPVLLGILSASIQGLIRHECCPVPIVWTTAAKVEGKSHTNNHTRAVTSIRWYKRSLRDSTGGVHCDTWYLCGLQDGGTQLTRYQDVSLT